MKGKKNTTKLCAFRRKWLKSEKFTLRLIDSLTKCLTRYFSLLFIAGVWRTLAVACSLCVVWIGKLFALRTISSLCATNRCTRSVCLCVFIPFRSFCHPIEDTLKFVSTIFLHYCVVCRIPVTALASIVRELLLFQSSEFSALYYFSLVHSLQPMWEK